MNLAATRAPVRAKRATGRNLPVAIASGVALAGLFIGSLFLHDYVFLTFVALLVVGALLELDVAFRSRRLRPATLVAVGAGLVMLYGAYGGGPSAQALGLVLLGLGGMAWMLLERGRERVVASLGATCLMTLWVPFLASFLGLLLVRPNGAWIVMAAIALAVANDIGAYALGSRFGRHRLAPRVSPGKSWEGFAGGLATVLVLAGLVTARVPGFDVPTALAFGAVVAVAGTVGDLAESLVKRDLRIKDLGRIMPGHGGIMDRVDAILFALPAAHLLLLGLGS